MFGLGLACHAEAQSSHAKNVNLCQTIMGKKRVKIQSTDCPLRWKK